MFILVHKTTKYANSTYHFLLKNLHNVILLSKNPPCHKARRLNIKENIICTFIRDNWEAVSSVASARKKIRYLPSSLQKEKKEKMMIMGKGSYIPHRGNITILSISRNDLCL